jgi:hypothetical protein
VLRAHPGRRHRLLIWLDEAGQPLQVAAGTWYDDVKLHESTWEPGPFDTLHDVADAGVRALDIQLMMWDNDT